jgi:hypothetical protein
MEGMELQLNDHDTQVEGGTPTEVAVIIPGFQRFPREAIQHLTSVSLMFFNTDISALQPTSSGWKHWISTISLLAHETNLPRLSLELRLSEKYFVSIWKVAPEPDPEYETHMQETYTRLIEPMLALKGLRNFFVHLNWDSGCGVKDKRLEMEGRLERMVMGEEYDAGKCGKVACYDHNDYDYY